MTAEPAISRRDVGLRSERGPILLALMLSTGLIAIDATILATAVPSIVKDLGGFASFPWLFSVYLLAQAVSVPIYAKLVDSIGRKPLLLYGIGMFLLGSILCGFAPSMLMLILFRAVQGLGAGAIMPTAITVAGDIYTLAERAKAQGYLASVWAISSVVGPTLGGVFSQFVSWRWIFFVNVPLCIAAAVLVRRYEETPNRSRHRVDVPGAILLTAGLTALLLGLLQGGQAWPWLSLPGLGLPAVAVVLLVAFVLVERRAPEPVLPLWVFSRRLLLTTGLISAAVGAFLLGLTSYIPNFLEAVGGASPLESGLALALLTLGWPIAASNAGRFYLRLGFRPTALIGSSVALVGAVGILLVTPLASIWATGAACLVVGLGLGTVATPTLIAGQSSVGFADRGVVTGSNTFLRSVGSAVGVAVFGAIANAVLAGRTSPAAVGSASGAVFLGVVVAGALLLVAALVMPAFRAEHAAQPEAEGAAA
ncbi:MDR family MFS transporter [Amnibacterium kyonggiense]|uniref:EmrB/QacA subfamily drug resistance transporter n=1 Tax=Amnibacterium kyonggiense TaxID=595671 RepID=A0A4R7FSH6_9MICO|nr:MDR family MFS transporter [Amnibacterium kyonggiense]TDS80746.1 EmrB/QacA subfamily drug resistance transporter [Amnibacterium kyonggiense]